MNDFNENLFPLWYTVASVYKQRTCPQNSVHTDLKTDDPT